MQAAPPPCLSSQLHVRRGRASAALGTSYVALVFVNRSSRTCSLRGFPGVSAVAGNDGHQVGAKPVRARGLRIYPPGEHAALYLPSTHPACSTTIGRTVIRPVRAGRGSP
jgi:hypothetical protein